MARRRKKLARKSPKSVESIARMVFCAGRKLIESASSLAFLFIYPDIQKRGGDNMSLSRNPTRP
ncbi:MAG: hypothetical protein ACPGVA_17850, partial [Pikeienuella sp.]